MKDIAENIRTLRESNNLTKTELARLLDVSMETIHKYENNIIKNIPLDKVIKLSNIFSVSPQYLLGWSESNIDIELLQLLEKLNDIEQAEIRGSIKFLLEKEKYKKNLKSKKIYLIKNYIKTSYQMSNKK